MGERSRETNSPVSAYSRRSLAQPWGVCKALFPDYFAGFRLVDYRPMLLYMPIVAALASGAGACLLTPGTRRLIGPGFLLGMAAATSSSVLNSLVDIALGPWRRAGSAPRSSAAGSEG